MKKKAIVFMLSDFMDDDYERNTQDRRKNKHDITGIRVYDKHDEEIPNLGMVPMLDAETNQVHLVNTSSKTVRRNYKANATPTFRLLPLYF